MADKYRFQMLVTRNYDIYTFGELAEMYPDFVQEFCNMDENGLPYISWHELIRAKDILASLKVCRSRYRTREKPGFIIDYRDSLLLAMEIITYPYVFVIYDGYVE